MENRTHYPHLDGWRGLAIVAVLIAHFFPNPWEIGIFGVDLFFVLSGLLMSRILFEQKMPIATFYKRRASRILPVFWLYLAVVIPVSIWVGLPVVSADIWATPLFLRTYFTPDIWNAAPPIGHIWSLNVEEHSYIVLSLVAVFAMTRSAWVTIGLGFGTVVAYYALARWDSGNLFFLRSEAAATPLLLSAGYRQIRLASVPKWTPLAAVALAMPSYGDFEIHWIYQNALSPILLAFAVNHIGQTYSPVLKALSARPLVLMGIWSYSVYLWHAPFSHNAYWIGVLPAFIMAMAVGLTSYYFFEQPVRKWINAR